MSTTDLGRYETQIAQLRKPPRTAAARQKLADILDAVQRCCERTEFDQLAVLDICNEAGISISSFYARLHSKDELLQLMHACYLVDMETELRAEALLVDWNESDNRKLISEIVERYIGLRRRTAQAFRVMSLAELRHAELFHRRQWADRRALSELADLVIGERAGRSDATEAKRRIEFVSRVVVASVQDLVSLQRNFPDDGSVDDDELCDSMSAMVASFLGPYLSEE